MVKPRLSLTEKSILILVLVILVTGFVLFYSDFPLFEAYVQEDGLVEWLTVSGLLLGVFVCIIRFKRLRKYKNWWFLFVVLDLGLLLFFAAGEEISWGQRILGIKSSEFFLENNAQAETNFHNLVVDGVKLNKIIFSIGLVAVMAVYLLIVPLLYRKKQKIRDLINKSAIPVARAYQVISILLLFLLTELLRHEKRAELLEAGIALLLFLIIRYPQNRSVFDKDPVQEPS